MIMDSVILIRVFISLINIFKSRAAVKRHQCGGSFVDHSGTITSPNYPFPYPPNIFCHWTIKAPRGVDIDLELSAFEILTLPGYPCHDFLQITGGILRPYRRCGLNFFKQHMASKSNEVNVTFYSDSNREGSGFKLSWRMDPHQMYVYQKSRSNMKISKLTSVEKTILLKQFSTFPSLSETHTSTFHVIIISSETKGSQGSDLSMSRATQVTSTNSLKKGKVRNLKDSELQNIERTHTSQVFSLRIALIIVLIIGVSAVLVSIICFKRNRSASVSGSEDIEEKYKYHDPESLGLYRQPPIVLNDGNGDSIQSAHSSSCSEDSYLEPVTSLWPIACHDKSMKDITDSDDAINYSHSSECSSTYEKYDVGYTM